MKTVKKLLIAGILALIPVVSAFAQQDLTRFGVIDTSRVYTTYFRSSAGVRNYDSKLTEFQTEVKKKTEELEALQKKIVEAKNSGNETQELKLQAEYQKKYDFLTEYSRTKRVELDSLKKKLETSDEFYEKLYNAIEHIAESEGYSIILSLQDSNSILWYSPTVDITDKVISQLSSIL
ncbi:MAG: OmpH family outer membrane protein [Treponemataceae bacterium]|nr:OmpH family outer membrane protein [Treponemataceae bacterium]